MTDFLKGFFINDKFPSREWGITREAAIKQTEELMKKYDITPDRIVADRHTLKWLFLAEQSQPKVKDEKK